MRRRYGLDAVLVTVEERTQGEIAFEVFEGFLDLCKQHVELPDLAGSSAQRLERSR